MTDQNVKQLAALPDEVMRLIYAYGDACRDGKSTERFCDLVMAIRRLMPTLAEGWQPIETAPASGREMFVVRAFNVTYPGYGARSYTSDPYCVWPEGTGVWARWPHPFPPTHWMPLPDGP